MQVRREAAHGRRSRNCTGRPGPRIRKSWPPASCFETVSFSAEDKARADYYRSNAQRAEILNKTGDMESYLQSLDMVCEINPVDAMSRARRPSG